ncbi:MAG: hypothetical protein EOO06_13365 [Chitinophagaceae bacterium]|nr:MAG: hypothetical protein EOO06_13365 [Chitinophagaceae bacterium]
MTLSGFRSLPQSQQFQLFKAGIEVGTYDDECTIRKCRQVEDFYVEYVLDVSDAYRMYIIAHRNTDHLDKYFLNYPPVDLQQLLEK